MKNQMIPKIKYDSFVRFWLGNDNEIHKVLTDILSCDDNSWMRTSIVRSRISDRLANDEEFYNAALSEMINGDDFDYILRCIHDNEEDMSPEEWEENYGQWTHLTTAEQVANEYYGRDGIISFVPDWYMDAVYDSLMDDYRWAINKLNQNKPA